MSENKDYLVGKQEGLILGELKALRESVDSVGEKFNGFQNDIWPKVSKHGESLKVLETEVGDLKSAKNWTLAVVGGAILTAIVGLVIKK